MRAPPRMLAAALVAPAAALAGGPTLIDARDVPLHAARTTAAAAPRFNMRRRPLARAPARVALPRRAAPAAAGALGDARRRRRPHRARALASRQPRLDGRADRDPRSARAGSVTRVRAYYVVESRRAAPARAGSQIANAPPIIPRLVVGRGRVDPPRARRCTRPRSSFAVVHHTAGTNNYTAAQSAAIVRGIELYHVKGNGWNDIGYNFLVDKYGQVFEGRYGGVDQQRHRRARAGLQHRLRRRRGARQLRHEAAPPQLQGRRSSSCSRGGSISRTSTRSRSCRGARAATHGSRPAFRSRCARSPVTATRASPIARATRCTRSCRRSRRTVAALGGPKIYAPRAAAQRRGPGSLHRARLDARSRGRSRSTDSTGAQVAQGTAPARPWTGRGTRPPRRRTGTRGRSRPRTHGPPPARSAPSPRSRCRRRRRRRLRSRPARRRRCPTRSTSAATITAALVAPAGQISRRASHRAEARRRADAHLHPAARPAERPVLDHDRRDRRGEDARPRRFRFDDRRHPRPGSARPARR